MLEEIKKEIDEMFIYDIRRIKGTKKYIELIDKGYVLGIIDKNDNQSDYKSAFKKLKQEFGFETVENMNGKKDCLGNFMQELEQKYKLGGE